MADRSLLSLAREQLRATDHSPALVYFDRILRDTLRYFEHLTAAIPHRRCLYSVKAASFPFLLRRLHAHGIAGFDASSSTEAGFVGGLFGNRVPLYVTAPSLSREDIRWLRPLKLACVHLDSLDALALFLAEAPEIPLGLRLNPGLGYARVALHEAGGASSRLGLPLHELDDALELFRRHGRTCLGLHFHLTCEAPDFSVQTDTVRLLTETLATSGRLDGLELTHLDMGGGLRPPAWDFAADQLVPRVDEASAQRLADAVSELIARLQRHLPASFATLFETGDLLACSAAVMVSRVIE